MKKIVLTLGALALFAFIPLASAATVTVDIATDDYDIVADADCSLREAITAANSDADFGGCVGAGAYGDDIIAFDSATDVGNAGPITLAIAGTGEDVNLSGDLDIFSNITFNGNGSSLTVVDADTIDRVVDIASGSTVIMNDLQLVNGAAGAANGGGIYSDTSALTLNDSIVTTCAATNGGAIYVGGSSGSLTLNSTTISDNDAVTDGAGISIQQDASTRTVLLDNVTLSGNDAGGDGGGIDITGGVDLDIQNGTTISTNTAAITAGGGIRFDGTGTADISDSTIDNNTALSGGGALFGAGVVTNIMNSDFDSNSAELGGGITAGGVGQMTITDTLFTGNSAVNGGRGGGIYNSGGLIDVERSLFTANTGATGIGAAIYSTGLAADMNVFNTTVSGNTATAFAGIVNEQGDMLLDSVTMADNSPGDVLLSTDSGVVEVQNSIFSNGAEDNCGTSLGGTIVSNGYNIDSANLCGFASTGDQTNTDPTLDVLADNGGSTFTHALIAGSPAIDAGSTTLTEDQRGSVRPQGIAADIGAFEVDADPILTEVTPVPSPTDDTTPDWTFNSTEAGTITYSGDCSSATTMAVVGNNTITFDALSSGVHNNCFITVTDSDLNVSNILIVTGFEVGSTSSSGGGGAGGSVSPPPKQQTSPTTSTATPEVGDCAGYSDVDADDQDCDAIEYVQSIGAMTGNDDGTFGPNDFVQRDQMAKIVLEAWDQFDENMDYCEGAHPFPDVTSGDWSYQYVCRAKELGVVTGYLAGPNAGLFKPGNHFILVEFWAMVLRNVDATMEAGLSFAGFETDAWYSPYAKFVADNDLYEGSSPMPTELVPRRDVAEFLYDLHLMGELS